jgi:hypothetical protein
MPATTPAAKSGSAKFDGVNIYWATKRIDGIDVPVINAFYIKGRVAQIREAYGLTMKGHGVAFTGQHEDALKRLIGDLRMQRRESKNGKYHEYVVVDASALNEMLNPSAHCPICDAPVSQEGDLCDDGYCEAEYAAQVDLAGRIAADCEELPF